MTRLPSTTALACFETAARLGSFTRAAHEMQLTQAAVSRQVIGLETPARRAACSSAGPARWS